MVTTSKMKLILWIASFLVSISFSISGDILVTAPRKRLTRSIEKTLPVRGMQQCVKNCEDYGPCKAVNYNRNELTCQFLRDATIDTSELVDDEQSSYIDVNQQTTKLSSCSANCENGQCVKLSSGEDYCNVKKCPLSFHYSSSLNFCYIQTTHGDEFPGAIAYCKSIGCRLAILPTLNHILFLKAEHQNGILENSRYRIGGQWNEEAGRWLWVNGDPVFGASGINQTDCIVDSNNGDLMWDEKDNLRNTNSGNREKYICEKVLV
ncbi:uncharacterized protein LOC111107829 [Crassostrea virginica]